MMIRLLAPLLCTLIAVVAIADDSFPRDSLVLWLDARNADSVQTDDAGGVTRWSDQSGNNHHADAQDDAPRPARLDEAGGLVRMTPDGQPTPLRTPALTGDGGGVTGFVVARRPAAVGDRGKWQRVLSVKTTDANDNEAGGIAWTLLPEGGGEAFPLTIYTYQRTGVGSNLPMTIGTTAEGQPGGGLLADIGEVLVFDKLFDDPSDYEAVVEYLIEKWKADFPRGHAGWVRQGDIPSAIKPIDRTRPLFAQTGDDGWQTLDQFTDEFDRDQLDADKWWDHYPAWHGRPPARYLPENVSVADGHLRMQLKKDDSLPRVQLHADTEEMYYGYSAAAVVSKAARTYGCFEVRIKPARATCTSSFWINGGAVDLGGVERRNEIDVFELPAGHAGSEKKFGMNMHVFKEPETDAHWSNWGNWYADFEFADDFHVATVVWGPRWVRWYVDGHCVRTTRNLAWHVPLQTIFDMEIMSWLPFPPDDEFPATYEIDYIRGWKHADWPEGDWRTGPRWTPRPIPDQPTGVTEIVREFQASKSATPRPPK